MRPKRQKNTEFLASGLPRGRPHTDRFHPIARSTAYSVVVQLTVTAVEWGDGDAIALRRRQRAEVTALQNGAAEHGRRSAADVTVLLMARDHITGAALACGGLRALGDDVAEIKRMYVIPERRGRGVGRVLLAQLERRALAAGWTTVRLEAGPWQTAALSLCQAAGYEEIAPTDGDEDVDVRSVPVADPHSSTPRHFVKHLN
jgi:GNAT superfamily N-acetyltransferase